VVLADESELRARLHPAGQLLRQTSGEGQIKKGNWYFGALFGETAVGKTQTREGARYRRLARRRGRARALVASATPS
jgi:hypothetical protein